MNTLTKRCRKCKEDVELSGYYVRSGIENPTERGHYISECKNCMKERTKGQKHMPRGISRVETENVAIQYLAAKGIAAMPGKACMMPDTDVTAYGVVGIEVKLGRWIHQGWQEVCMFSTSPKQQTRGFLAHVVMMLIPRKDVPYSFHLLDSAHPVFYKDGHVKTGWTYVEDRYEAIKHGDYYTVLTEDVMQQAQDNVSIIWAKIKEVSQSLSSGKALAELLPCVSQPNWDLIGGVIPELYG